MGKTTTYTCDRPGCGHEQDNGNQMWHIGITISELTTPMSLEHPRKKELWCRECIERLGLLPQPKGEEPHQPPPPETFEDKIRELIREELEA